MQRRTIVFVTVGIFALGSCVAIAQGRAEGSNQGIGAGAYHGGGGYYGGHYGYRPGYNGGWGGYRGWYGPGLGIYIGAPWYWGSGFPYYPYAGNAAYPAYVVPSSAFVGAYESYPETIEPQSDVEQEPAPSAYWFYCTDPAGYYPYIQRCQAAWMRVTPENVPPGQ